MSHPIKTLTIKLINVSRPVVSDENNIRLRNARISKKERKHLHKRMQTRQRECEPELQSNSQSSVCRGIERQIFRN